MTDVRLLTLNLFGAGDGWPQRRSLLAAGLATLAPDLVTLQEVVCGDGVDQASSVLGPLYRVVHQERRDKLGRGVATASRWPIGRVLEVDLPPAPDGFPSTSLVTEILAPDPVGRVWLVNHLPSWAVHQEHERQLQSVAAARAIERLAAEAPGHVVVAGDLDADPDATSVRFWTGRHALDGTSVCYRDAWESRHPGEPGHTFVPENPYAADWDWPYRRIDYVLVRCGLHGGPTLAVADCRVVFDGPENTVSDHYGVLADLVVPTPPTRADRRR
jgi:endonuclease/exonuclease/phosphatase family metal-dependent hydrolase